MNNNIILPRTWKSLEWPISVRFVDQYYFDQYFVDQYFVDQYFAFTTTLQMQALNRILVLLLYFNCHARSTPHIEQLRL